MQKIYKKLTEEQKRRNVIFSSCLSIERTEQEDDKIHEVFNGQIEGQEQIDRLLDDRFFNKSHFKYNIIRR